MNDNYHNSLMSKLLNLNSHFEKLGIIFRLEEQRYASNSFSNDFTLILTMQNELYRFNVNVKRQLAGNTAINMINDKHYSQNNFNTLLVADYISSQVEEYLLERKISFINASGKVFLHQDQFLLYFDYPNKSNQSRVLGAAFESTGIKFIFHLLNEPGSINRSYHELANITGVSAGSITNIIKDLKRNGFVYTLNSKRILRNKNELLDQWYVVYGRKVRPKISIGKYRLINSPLQTQLPKGCLWGGEVAAEFLNLNLRSQDQIIYTEMDPIQVIKELRLIPDENGQLELLKVFWNTDISYEHNNKVVPGILIYTDLMLSGNDRNIEVAHETLR